MSPLLARVLVFGAPLWFFGFLILGMMRYGTVAAMPRPRGWKVVQWHGSPIAAAWAPAYALMVATPLVERMNLAAAATMELIGAPLLAIAIAGAALTVRSFFVAPPAGISA